jgi:hypothetical protein
MAHGTWHMAHMAHGKWLIEAALFSGLLNYDW